MQLRKYHLGLHAKKIQISIMIRHFEMHFRTLTRTTTGTELRGQCTHGPDSQ